MSALLCTRLMSSTEATDEDARKLDEASRWLRTVSPSLIQYDYVMTAKLRLLFFWVGSDDVGGGYIRYGRGAEGGDPESLSVLFGSDPAKAPRKINRWGAATEVLQVNKGEGGPVGSAFFGFMKASKGKSVSEMQKELSNEQTQGRHLFEAIMSRVDGTAAVSRVVPFHSDEDFNLHDLDRATSMVIGRLSAEEPSLRKLERAGRKCADVKGFLFTVHGLIEAEIAGKVPPLSACYTYNAREYGARLTESEKVDRLAIRVKLRGRSSPLTRTYQDLMRSRFEVIRQDNKARTTFEIVYGRSGALRGMPVQITYQPNWWFKVVLNLLSEP